MFSPFSCYRIEIAAEHLKLTNVKLQEERNFYSYQIFKFPLQFIASKLRMSKGGEYVRNSNSMMKSNEFAVKLISVVCVKSALSYDRLIPSHKIRS